MWSSLEFVLGLMDRHEPACVAAEDFEGVHGPALQLCQRLGFLCTDPEPNPVASCPHCREGVPVLLGELCVCSTCQCPVDRSHLLLWRLDLEALLSWLALALQMEGGVRRIDERLWQLGHFTLRGLPCACFFRRSGPLSRQGHKRLLAYRNAILLQALPGGEPIGDFRGHHLSLLEIIRRDESSLGVADLAHLLWDRGVVSFDEHTGVVRVGDAWLGELPVGSREYHFLALLSQNKDRFVPYADIKHYVLEQSGARDSTEEATFCQKLKSRIKAKRWIPKIDALIVTTHKADGYRLRGFVEL